MAKLLRFPTRTLTPTLKYAKAEDAVRAFLANIPFEEETSPTSSRLTALCDCRPGEFIRIAFTQILAEPTLDGGEVDLFFFVYLTVPHKEPHHAAPKVG